jgi:aryl-alcohol dehydrogenase-like predicted oxidoreductase
MITSRLGFGTSSLHHLISAKARQDLLGHAWSEGHRYFDTAPYYGHGMAERELGRFLSTRRSQAIVASKFGIRANPVFRRAPYFMYAGKALGRLVPNGRKTSLSEPARDYRAAEARRSVERSLLALRTDHIDILFLHEPELSQLQEAEELVRELERLQRAGKIRYVGLSGSLLDSWEIARRYPSLGAVLQVESSNTLLGIARASQMRPQITFGHFRHLNGGLNPADDVAAGLRQAMQQAVTGNPDGVILFSSRQGARICDMSKLLSAAEAEARGLHIAPVIDIATRRPRPIRVAAR